MIVFFIVYSPTIWKNDVGIKSKILMEIIIDKEKAKQKEINLFKFASLNLKKIKMHPRTVDNPAIVDNNKG